MCDTCQGRGWYLDESEEHGVHIKRCVLCNPHTTDSDVVRAVASQAMELPRVRGQLSALEQKLAERERQRDKPPFDFSKTSLGKPRPPKS